MVSLLPTKTLTIDGDTRLGQSGVPASVLLPRDGTWLTQEPPSRFICQPFALFYLLHCCRNLASFYFILDFTASEPSSEQGRREFTSH